MKNNKVPKLYIVTSLFFLLITVLINFNMTCVSNKLSEHIIKEAKEDNIIGEIYSYPIDSWIWYKPSWHKISREDIIDSHGKYTKIEGFDWVENEDIIFYGLVPDIYESIRTKIEERNENFI